MRRCTRVGIDVTKRCQWTCKTCFYRWRADFNQPYDRSLEDVMNELRAAKTRGCDHAVVVGWGEPTLWPNLIDFVIAVKDLGMTSSIITNGMASIDRYVKLRVAGLNHLHISCHAIGTELDEIAGLPGAGKRQRELMEWLRNAEWPWRMNMTVQKINYQNLLNIAAQCVAHGCRHIISLGFLPHYEWNDPNKLRQVAVHPKELRPYIEDVIKFVENCNSELPDSEKVMMTVRYHPMCHLATEYRKYIVNARYVLYDPWEWEYGNAGKTDDSYWQAAVDIGNTVSIIGTPCYNCDLGIHCGGWNRIYAAGFDGADLHAIETDPIAQFCGYLHDQNPANHGLGYF